ncbi:monooxygenase [Daedalea quercina L-15889]|uniref:Monooxygenase n=1 Tax=Daedalea quercina L-15889 TaxID=1314783 RepID=A0A165QLK6_9APHY|nr:monooxygenase [Daedalea quercina L-15889]
MSEDATVPVLIVGAGPAGLAAALTLRKNGIPVRVIEKEPRARVGQRGAGIMPRSQELFKILGVIDDICVKAIGLVPMRMYKLPEGIEPITTFALDPTVAPTPSAPYSNVIMLGQNHSEEILRDHLKHLGCEVELGTTLYSIQSDGDHVQAHVLKKAGDDEIVETIKCRWLIGTDGARGAVRKQLGLAFDGETFGVTHHLVVGDLHIKGLDKKHWHYWGDLDTILVMLRATEDEDVYFLFIGGQVDHAKIVAERAELERMLKVGTGRTDLEIGAVRFISEYKPHVRMAETFRKGRVFVAGDAAHIHTPFGGQGLNSSVQDAVNLGWKLSLIEKGVATPSLLDSYTEERLPVITHMLRMSTKLFNDAAHVKADGTGGETAWHRGGEIHMLGVNCRWSSIIVDERTPKEATPVDPYGVTRFCTDAVRAGERAPDAPGLVVLGAAADSTNGAQKTSLFNIFASSYHTVLIFGDGTSKAGRILSVLQAYPAELLRMVLVHTERLTSSIPGGGYLSVLDRDGHAHEGYQVQKDEFIVVIVRPDGVIGGIVRDTEGAKQYFARVFNALADQPLPTL